MPTFAQLSKSLRARLVCAGIDEHEARREVDLIIEHVSGHSVARQVLVAEEPVAIGVLEQTEAIAMQREQRIPLQYCLGQTWFMGLPFKVRPGVLIPRSDTEILVEAVLVLLKDIRNPMILDVGTGSGIIAIALAHFRPDLHAVALDISDTSMSVAPENAELNKVEKRIEFIQTDWYSYAGDTKFNAIVSNPPYIPPYLAATLDPEVGVFEPKEALFGSGEDGLGFYRSFSQNAAEHLLIPGFLMVEVGQGQANEVRNILTAGGWQSVQAHNDLDNIERVVTAFRA